MIRAPKPVEIVGGGLAGLSLGIALRRAGVPVAVFEAGDYPRHRVCGEFIAGLAPETVDRLGIGGVFEGSLRHARARWFLAGRPAGEVGLPVAAIGLSRFLLDARLAHLFVAHGGKLTTRSRMAEIADAEGRVLAFGRRRSVDSPWVGLKVHLRNLATPVGDLEMHLGLEAYVGLARVEDGWVNLCGLFKRRAGLKMDSVETLAATLRACGLEGLAERVEGAELREGSACAVAGFAFDRRIESGRGVVLGDACAMIPPFTGNGMAMAFTGAELAVEPLLEWSGGHLSWEQATQRIEAALKREFRLRIAGAAWLHPFLLETRRQTMFGAAARAGILPLRPLYHLLH